MSIIQLNVNNCKNCYKCVRYCPVKAIEVKNHVAQIIERECIHCGTCTTICPQNAKENVSEVEAVKSALSQGARIVASVAPSCTAYFSTDLPSLKEALLRLGFAEVRETAEGAYLVKSAYERLVDGHPGMTYISSCCASVNAYIKKYRPRAQPNLLPVLTPIQAHARLIKQQDPEAEVCFICPCTAKKGEMEEEISQYDHVLLFEELEGWLDEAGIELEERVERNTADPRLSRLFPKTGGILQTMRRNPGWRYLTVDGFEDCALAIDDVIAGRMENCFLEMNFCRGGCVGGPSFRRAKQSIVYSELKVRNSANTRDHAVDFNITGEVDVSRVFNAKRVRKMQPSEAQILATLRAMGKHSREDELNCGMCGYSTCREKAKAVLQGKAEISMCVPFMREKAESFAGRIVDILPDALLSVDGHFCIQQINRAACELFRLNAESVIGMPVSRILDEYEFVSFMSSGETQLKKKTFLPDYNIYLNMSFQRAENDDIIVVTMEDISKEKRARQQSMEAKLQAASMADDIVDKQLRVVHEIAYLLGETAAETKVAIADLKKTILMDEEEGQ